MAGTTARPTWPVAPVKTTSIGGTRTSQFRPRAVGPV
jgi:hypothetical protein